MWKKVPGAALALVLLQPTLGFAAPNIFFILVDDLRWDDLGCAGNDFVSSPNIDRIAREERSFKMPSPRRVERAAEAPQQP